MIRSAVSDRMAKGRNLGGERHRCVASSLKHGRSRAALIMSLSSSYSYSYIHRNSTTTVIYSSPSASPRRRTDMSTCALWQMGPFPPSDHLRARRIHSATTCVRAYGMPRKGRISNGHHAHAHAPSSCLRCCH